MARRGRFVISDLSSVEKTDITLQQSGIHKQQSGPHNLQANQPVSGQSGGNPIAQPSVNPPVHNGLHSHLVNEIHDMGSRPDSHDRNRLENTDIQSSNSQESKRKEEDNVPISVLNGFQDILSSKVSVS